MSRDVATIQLACFLLGDPSDNDDTEKRQQLAAKPSLSLSEGACQESCLKRIIEM